jgi:predicted transcriptional regulator
MPGRQPHRDHYEIIKQVLQNVYAKVGGCGPAELAYRCELTWFQFIRYRDILLSNKLLIPSEITDNELTLPNPIQRNRG